MKKLFKIRKISVVSLLTVIICFLVFFLTIGFSSYQTSIDINGIAALVRIQREIRITGITINSIENNGMSYYEEYDIDSVDSRIYLPSLDSSVTFDVEVINSGNVEMAISSITGLPENLKYTLTGYNLGNALCDDDDATSCKLGSKTTLTIKIEYSDSAVSAYDSPFLIDLEFNFVSLGKAAKIGNTYYDTLQKAINAVPTNNVKTTVTLLKNVSEIITVAKNKNIVFDFQNKTLSNSGNNPVIQNNGTIEINNGIIRSDAPRNGAINNEATGVITISGGSVIVTGGRQALYNNKGTAYISGDAYLTSSATERVAVQNLNGGNMTITGGTIISTGLSGVGNAGTLTIGVKDGDIDDSSPIIQGIEYGVDATAKYNFYNGALKGKRASINNNSNIDDKEEGYDLVIGEENIYGELYKVAVLGIPMVVTFNPNGGVVDETERGIANGFKVGTLPVPIRAGYEFISWFTLPEGGSHVTENTIINGDITFYAHWEKIHIARVDSTNYDTLQDAIDAVPVNNVETTVVLLHDTYENLTVAKNKNILFDLQDYSIGNPGKAAIFENNGTIKIQNGKITSSNADTAIINNNNGGKLIITGGEIISTGTRQAIYNLAGGIIEISGGYLRSTASGKPNVTYSNLERATVQNLVGGTLTITGGTIIGINQQAISNEGNLTIGTKDGIITSSTPIIRGKTIGLKTISIFNFYDGVIQGTNSSIIDGDITDTEENSSLVSGTQVIDGTTYNLLYLN